MKWLRFSSEAALKTRSKIPRLGLRSLGLSDWRSYGYGVSQFPEFGHHGLRFSENGGFIEGSAVWRSISGGFMEHVPDDPQYVVGHRPRRSGWIEVLGEPAAAMAAQATCERTRRSIRFPLGQRSLVDTPALS